MREIEVLYDNLLALFATEPELTPRDILVMAPDIGSYAPFIQAVFDTPEQPSARIPFSRIWALESPWMTSSISVFTW